MGPAGPGPACRPRTYPRPLQGTRPPAGRTGEDRKQPRRRGFPAASKVRPERRPGAEPLVDLRTGRPRPRRSARRETQRCRRDPRRTPDSRRRGCFRRDRTDRRDPRGQDSRGVGRPTHPRAARRRRRHGRVHRRRGLRCDRLRRKAAGQVDGRQQQRRPHPERRRTDRDRASRRPDPLGDRLSARRAHRTLPQRPTLWPGLRTRQRKGRTDRVLGRQVPPPLRPSPHRRRQRVPPRRAGGSPPLRLRPHRRAGGRFLPRRHAPR